MSTKNLTLAEAANEILKASIAKAPKEGPQKLPGEVDDTGDAIVKNDAPGKVYDKNVSKDKSEPTKTAAAPEGPKKLSKGSIPEEKITVNVDDDDKDDDDDSGDEAPKKDKIKLDGNDVKGGDGGDDEDDDSDDNDDDSDDDEDDNKNPFKKEERRSVKSVLEQKIEIDVTEDIAAMFKGTKLTEEFKEKAATIFEAAVSSKVKQIQNKLAEAFDEILDEEVKALDEEYSEKIDDFMTMTAKEWLEENKVELENNLRNELTEDFITGLKNLFAENYIDIPEDKVDVVAEMADANKELKALLDEQYSEKLENNKYITELEKTIVLGELVKEHNLNLAQEEKILELAEDVKFTTADAYSKKVTTLIESYIGGNIETAPDNKKKLVEDVELQTEEVSSDATVARLAAALSRYS